ncbi:MAG: hypothetical protein UZ18_ATM001002494 [Armatimonadetes bacterium OLB18]|nr:MAG: hypothetical protein UZ18_ATM001002494 [Armatimonadetes bacterium OLB18]
MVMPNSRTLTNTISALTTTIPAAVSATHPKLPAIQPKSASIPIEVKNSVENRVRTEAMSARIVTACEVSARSIPARKAPRAGETPIR